MIISDYAKGAITDEVVDAFAGYVRPVFIDTKHDPDMFMPISDVTFFPNLVEYKKYLASYTRLGGKLILKRSADGLEYYEHNRLVASVPAYAKFVKSVNGAGDTVIAAYAYAKVMNIDNPLQFAACAAAIVVEKPYTATASLDEVWYLMNEVNNVKARDV